MAPQGTAAARLPGQEVVDLDVELQDLQHAIHGHRETIASLNEQREIDENRYDQLKAEQEERARAIETLHASLHTGAEKRREVIAELDLLLQNKANIESRRDMLRASAPAVSSVSFDADADPTPAVLPPPSSDDTFSVEPFAAASTMELEIDMEQTIGVRMDDVPHALTTVPAPSTELELELDIEPASAATPPATPLNLPTALRPTAQVHKAAPPRAAVQAHATAAPAPAPAATLKVAPPLPSGQIRSTQPRVPICVDVDLRSENNLYVGFSENVSEGGLFVATYTPRPVGERLTLQFTLPGQTTAITCEVQVAWHLEPRDVMAHDKERVPGMGLRFVDITPSDQAMLANFVSQREPMFFPG